MTTQALRYTVLSLLVAALVAAAGAWLAGPAALSGVLAGAAIGVVVQVAVFWVFLVWLFPGQGWNGYGMGLLVRFAVFALAAFVLVPAAGLPLGATLFSLVAVFWLTTLMEPAFLKARTATLKQG